MGDPLTDYLLHDTTPSKISPEKLELMGKQASNAYLDSGVSLNEGIAKLAGEHPDINKEQIKRVCEFANNATYLAIHDKAKTAGAITSYPQFDLADPARVIQDLSDGARPTVITPVDVDYGKQPQKTKISHPEVEEALAELFKRADGDLVLSKESAADEILAAKSQLQSLKAHLSHVNETFDMSLKQASVDLYEMAKRHVLDGNSFGDVVLAVRSVGLDQEKTAAVMTPIIGKLLSEKVASIQRLEEDMRGIKKSAHRTINGDHPMVQAVREVASSFTELQKTSAALSETEEQLGLVNAFIQEKFWRPAECS